MNNIPGSFVSLLKLKCPRCRRGDLFKNSAFSLKKVLDMPEHCPHCDLKYEIEPGFFWGAMYISYSLICAISIVFITLLLAFKFKWYILGAIYVTVVILLNNIIARYSRVLMIYLFSQVRFDIKYYKKNSPDATPVLKNEK